MACTTLLVSASVSPQAPPMEDEGVPDLEVLAEHDSSVPFESEYRDTPTSVPEVDPASQDQTNESDLAVQPQENMVSDKAPGTGEDESDSSHFTGVLKRPMDFQVSGDDDAQSSRLRRRNLLAKKLGKSVPHPAKYSRPSVGSTLVHKGLQDQPSEIAEMVDSNTLFKAAVSQDNGLADLSYDKDESLSFDRVTEDSEQESDITTREKSVGEAGTSWSRAYDSEEDGEIDEEGTLATPVEVTHARDDSTRADPFDGEAEERPTTEVYGMPEKHGQNAGPLISWPTGWVIQALGFQIRLLGQAFLLASSIFQWSYSFVVQRLQKTLEAKDKATEAVSQKLTMISQVPPKVTEGGSIMVKRMAWGCLAAAYACIFLSMLLFPAFFLEFMFVTKFVEEPVNIKETLHFDYTQSHPNAVVYLHPTNVQGALKGRPVRHPNKIQSLRPIPVSHRIHITVMLTMPESDYNRQLGMFQLAVELLSAKGEVIERSSHPCMLQFQSAPIRLAKTLLVGLPVLVGIAGETQTLVVRLMEYQEQLIPTSCVRVLLQPKAGYPSGGGLPEIYSAEILIESQLPWLKEFVRNWKWTFYVWSGLTLYMLEIMMVVCCCRTALVPTWGSRSEEEAPRDIPVRGNRTHGMEQDRSIRSHTRGRKRVYFEQDLPTAKVTSGSSRINMSTRAETRHAEHDERLG